MSAPLVSAVLRADWDRLAPPIRAFHGSPGHHRGEADIDRGSGLLAGIVARAFGFPRPGRGVPVSVTVEATRDGERWTRDFGGQRLRSELRALGPGLIEERFGPTVFRLAVSTQGDGLRLRILSGRVFGLALPRLLMPSTEAVERAEAGRFRFDIAIAAPLVGRIVHYRGWLAPVEAMDAGPSVMAHPEG